MQVDLITWAVDVLGAVDGAAVPRSVLTLARQSQHTDDRPITQRSVQSSSNF